MNKRMIVSELVNCLHAKGYDLKGCSPREIAAIEQFYNVQLPTSYKDFLSAMGKSAGEFMKGSDMFYESIFKLKEWSIELLEENDFKPLPENAFVFWMHQGYQFAFFCINENDDPAVYYFYEGRTKDDFEVTGDNFTSFLEKQLSFSMDFNA